MKLATSSIFAAVTSVSILAMSFSAAADPMNGCYGAKYTALEVLEITDDHMVIIYSAFGTGYVLEDTASPIHGMAGPCTGAIELKSGALIDQTGKCVRTDADGDRVLISATSEGDGSTGKWGLEGLTGKFVGATGSGSWEITADDGTYYHVCFDGSWTP
jgi:hypothetical protein